jgi:hypothetical protein
MSTSIPIIQSNAIVESFWARFKKDFLRPLRKRPRLEILVYIIMNEHMDKLAFQIEGHRNLEDPIKPKWYFDLNGKPD